MYWGCKSASSKFTALMCHLMSPAANRINNKNKHYFCKTIQKIIVICW